MELEEVALDVVFGVVLGVVEVTNSVEVAADVVEVAVFVQYKNMRWTAYWQCSLSGCTMDLVRFEYLSYKCCKSFGQRLGCSGKREGNCLYIGQRDKYEVQRYATYQHCKLSWAVVDTVVVVRVVGGLGAIVIVDKDVATVDKDRAIVDEDGATVDEYEATVDEDGATVDKDEATVDEEGAIVDEDAVSVDEGATVDKESLAELYEVAVSVDNKSLADLDEDTVSVEEEGATVDKEITCRSGGRRGKCR